MLGRIKGRYQCNTSETIATKLKYSYYCKEKLIENEIQIKIIADLKRLSKYLLLGVLI